MFIETALEPGASFPPDCCGKPITLMTLQQHIPQELATRFAKKQQQIFASRGLFCAKRGCFAKIPETAIEGRKGACLACKKSTCNDCKSEWHDSNRCPVNKDREATMQLAKKEGWQRCYHCSNVIELSIGCYHMT